MDKQSVNLLVVYYDINSLARLDHHQPYGWWKKSCISWYVVYPSIHKVLYIPGGCLELLPSTVSTVWNHNWQRPTNSLDIFLLNWYRVTPALCDCVFRLADCQRGQRVLRVLFSKRNVKNIMNINNLKRFEKIVKDITWYYQISIIYLFFEMFHAGLSMKIIALQGGKNPDETQELGYPRINSSQDDKDCDCDDDDDDDDDAAAGGVGGGGGAEEEQCAISPPEKRLRTAPPRTHVASTQTLCQCRARFPQLEPGKWPVVFGTGRERAKAKSTGALYGAFITVSMIPSLNNVWDISMIIKGWCVFSKKKHITSPHMHICICVHIYSTHAHASKSALFESGKKRHECHTRYEH